ncbi:hypothetical protein SEA_CECE_183 [Microbacterium phage Cece]|nr:hypothetical protein SEA_CECE_183 [Microbacterium phage Cece]
MTTQDNKPDFLADVKGALQVAADTVKGTVSAASSNESRLEFSLLAEHAKAFGQNLWSRIKTEVQK